MHYPRGNEFPRYVYKVRRRRTPHPIVYLQLFLTSNPGSSRPLAFPDPLLILTNLIYLKELMFFIQFSASGKFVCDTRFDDPLTNNDSPITEAYLYSHYLNHSIGFWARLCPSFLTFRWGPVKPRSLSEPHKILLAIYLSA